MNPKHLSMFLMLWLLFAACVAGQAISYLGADGNTYMHLPSNDPSHVEVDSGYDADLLVPHWNAVTDKWGYLHRKSKALVVPHRFTEAGKFANGFAVAVAAKADDASVEEFFRITADSVQYLFSDKVVKDKKGLVERGRMRDDWIVSATNGRVVCIDPQGKLVLDTLLENADRRFCYTQGGHYYLIENGKCNFYNFAVGQTASWDTSKFEVRTCSLLPYGETPVVPYFRVQNIRNDKVGIVDNAGRIVVPIEWEWPRQSFERLGLVDNPQLYNPCIDSLYLAYRDGQFFAMHLDGRVIRTYNDTLCPSAQGHLPWRNGRQLYAWYVPKNDGAMVALGTEKEPVMVQCGGCGMFSMDRDHVFNTWWSRAAILNLGTGEEEEIAGLVAYSSFAGQTAVKQGNETVVVLAAGPPLHYGAINQKGEVVVPFEYSTLKAQGNYAPRFLVLHGTIDDYETGKVIHRYYTTDRKLLFGGEFHEVVDGGGEPGDIVERCPMEDDHLRHCQDFHRFHHHLDTVHPFFGGGEFPPNLLLYVEEYVGKGKVAKGYVDVYGVRYF